MPIDMSPAPEFRFFKLIETAVAPTRADRGALGALPVNAYRYCDAITTASAFGWYLHAPMDFALLFDGREVFATWDGCGGWFPLDRVQFPGFADKFDASVPDHIRGLSPPFLARLPVPGAVQIWSGLIARSSPGWSTLIRPCANVPLTKGFDAFEGIVETDHWFGPLFINIRVLRTGVPIEIVQDSPLAMVQPIPQLAYSEPTLRAPHVMGLSDLCDADWENYRNTGVRPPHGQGKGRYAVDIRRRRRSETPTIAEAK